MDKYHNYACMRVSETALNVRHDRNSSNSSNSKVILIIFLWYRKPKKSLFSVETVRVNVLSKQLYLQNFQERCAQHGAFQRTTRNIKHRIPSYIGTRKTRDFWSKRAQIESKNHDNVVNIVLYWTFLGLSAPYEVVEWSCAIFCILIYFTRYKINMCVGTESVTVFKSVTEWWFSLVPEESRGFKTAFQSFI